MRKTKFLKSFKSLYDADYRGYVYPFGDVLNDSSMRTLTEGGVSPTPLSLIIQGVRPTLPDIYSRVQITTLDSNFSAVLKWKSLRVSATFWV